MVGGDERVMLKLRRVGGGGCHCGTIEVAGGGGCERFKVRRGEGGGTVDEAVFCFGFNLIVDYIFILLNELTFLLNSALVL